MWLVRSGLCPCGLQRAALTQVDFGEFCAAIGPLYTNPQQTLREAFNMFDADGNGSIDRDELRAM